MNRGNAAAVKGVGQGIGRTPNRGDVAQAALPGENAAAAAKVADNRAFSTQQTTSNGQGVGGDIVGVIGLTVKGSGKFRYAAGFSQAAAAATEVATGNAAWQTDANPAALTILALTNAGNATVGSTPPDGINTFANGAASTGIGFAAGFGGGGATLEQDVQTIGTAAQGYRFKASGEFDSAAAIGSHVYLTLKITNSATDRVVSNINMMLEEIPVNP